MKSKRALRLHHLDRIKRLTLEQVIASFPSQPYLWHCQVMGRYRNRTTCSCWMCGNPRRHAGRRHDRITRHERLAAIRESEQRQEVDEA
jgi:hypothetical protein